MPSAKVTYGGLWATLVALSPVAARAVEIDQAKAIRVEAAYVLNFAKFIEWPQHAFADDGEAFVIGVLDDEPFADALIDTVRDRRIANRPIEVERIRWDRAVDRDRLSRCHALYIGDARRGELADVLAELKTASGEPATRPTLAVSDIDGFARRGGMIGFVLERGRIVFEVSVEALERAGLKASSKLLTLARIVQKRADHGGEREQ